MADNFSDRLAAAVTKVGNPCCVGLDPNLDLFPAELTKGDPLDNIRIFQRKILDLAAGKVPVVKPQIAYYERYGSRGWDVYTEAVELARERELLVIGDVKRGDIGSTSEAYAKAHLTGPSAPDAITVNPFFGRDGVQPFINVAEENGKGLFILVRTSNASSMEIQGLQTGNDKSVSERIAWIVNKWGEELIGDCGYSSIGAVIGATHPEQLKKLRSVVPKAWVLLPGYGAQGGEAEKLNPAFDSNGLGGIVNSSRGILYAHENAAYQGLSWEEASEKALEQMIGDLAGAAGNS